jgi:hypothetical protein
MRSSRCWQVGEDVGVLFAFVHPPTHMGYVGSGGVGNLLGVDCHLLSDLAVVAHIVSFMDARIHSHRRGVGHDMHSQPVARMHWCKAVFVT